VSRTNIEVVRRTLDAYITLDEEIAAEVFDPQAEWHNTAVFPSPSVCVGPRQIVGLWRLLGEDFTEGGTELEDMSTVGNRVVAGIHSWGAGRTSGAPIDVHWAAVFELRDEQVVRVDVHGSYVKALAAARSET
jgi:ketosteroid isomerase-like protein